MLFDFYEHWNSYLFATLHFRLSFAVSVWVRRFSSSSENALNGERRRTFWMHEKCIHICCLQLSAFVKDAKCGRIWNESERNGDKRTHFKRRQTERHDNNWSCSSCSLWSIYCWRYQFMERWVNFKWLSTLTTTFIPWFTYSRLLSRSNRKKRHCKYFSIRIDIVFTVGRPNQRYLIHFVASFSFHLLR